MNAAAELYLQETILPDLDRGRPNWDRPHTELVVAYSKDIARESGLGLDEEVQEIAAYAHDWGYVGLLDGVTEFNLRSIKFIKKEHMKRGALKLAGLLAQPPFDYLSPEQKQRACHLVAVHDKIEKLSAPDELVLMEADTLAAFDSRVVSDFSFRDKEKWKAIARKRRVSRFVTEFSKNKIVELEAGAAALLVDEEQDGELAQGS